MFVKKNCDSMHYAYIIINKSQTFKRIKKTLKRKIDEFSYENV